MRSVLLIDTKIPDSFRFWFSDFEVYISLVSGEDISFCLQVLLCEISLTEIFQRRGIDNDMRNISRHISRNQYMTKRVLFLLHHSVIVPLRRAHYRVRNASLTLLHRGFLPYV